MQNTIDILLYIGSGCLLFLLSYYCIYICLEMKERRKRLNELEERLLDPNQTYESI